MKNSLKKYSLSLLLLALPTLGSANLIIDFVNGGPIEGFDVGDVASYTDPGSGVTAGLSVTGISGTNGVFTTSAGSGHIVNEASGSFGINSSGSGDNASRFDQAESVSFSWNVDSEFTFINLLAFTTLDSESFTIQSDGWIGLGVTPGAGSVVFDNVAGSFTLTDDGVDEFGLTELSGGVTLGITSGTSFLISYDNATGITDGGVQQLGFNLVPEPSSFMLSLLGIALLLARRKR